MSSGDGDHRNGKGPAEEALEEDNKFPAGLRVLAVDDDPVFLEVLGALLRFCKYKATTVTEWRTALEILRERGEEQFDLVITDLHMPDMDGFKLLELIGLEMDLPVIMISVNGEKATMYKGIVHGACDYLVKPVNIKQIKNIWQHVVRKNQVAINHNSSESDDDDDDDDDANQRMVQPVTVEHGRGDAKKSKKHLKKKKNGGHDSDKNRRVPTTQKKPRVSWNGDLHNRFIEAVNLLGVDRAVPKTILQVMNVKNLSRESVGSHLQKYRLFLKRIAEETEKYDPVDDSSDDEMDINPPVQPSSTICCCGSNMPCTAPSIIGPHGLSIQPRNRSMASNGGSMARNAVAPPVESSEDRPMLDLFHPHCSTKAYVGILREKLLEASSMVPASHPINSSVEEMPDGEPANQFPVQPSSFPGPMNGSHVVVPAQVTMLQINQLPSFGASSSQTAVFQSEQQNQMAGIFSNNSTTPMAGFNTQMTPLFSIASNTGPAVEMTQMMVNGGSTSSPFPSLGMTNGGSSSVGPPPSQMANGGGISSSSALPGLQDDSAAPADGGDVSGILPMQDGPSDQQSPVDDQPTPSTNLFLQQIFSSMVNPDFNPDGAPFGEEY